MLRAAAEGHRTLTEGQGAELCWARAPKVLTSLQVLDIFRRKTAPAFEVALRVGGALAGASEDVRDVFAKYSEALGIAYQIRDDIDDLTGTDAPDDIAALRPSLPLAVGVERAKGQHEEAHAALLAAWRRDTTDTPERCAPGSSSSAPRSAAAACSTPTRRKRFARSRCSRSRRSRACSAASSARSSTTSS
jgi:geranylgeranyl pyrophosphate synthase